MSNNEEKQPEISYETCEYLSTHNILYICAFIVVILFAGASHQSLQKENETLKKQNEELKDALNDFRKEFEAFKYKMSWKKFEGDAFDKTKDYRVRINKGGGYYLVDWVGSKELLFSVSTAAFNYGCVTIDKQDQWHYRMKGNSAQKCSISG